ncbi:MAG: hypothetical protein K2X39_09265 [Silvanigrellaceae bacterium]|nr:hypothetical protein [Silvanigrellaceae bacterium]
MAKNLHPLETDSIVVSNHVVSDLPKSLQDFFTEFSLKFVTATSEHASFGIIHEILLLAQRNPNNLSWNYYANLFSTFMIFSYMKNVYSSENLNFLVEALQHSAMHAVLHQFKDSKNKNKVTYYGTTLILF